MRVCVVSDDTPFARRLTAAIADDGLDTEWSHRDGLLGTPNPEVDTAVLDWRPSGTPDGQDIVKLRSHIRGPVIVVVPHAREGTLIAALAAGARGLVVRRSAAATVPSAVRAVQGGGLFIDPAIGAILARLVAVTARADDHGTDLTRTELRVLQRFPRGMTNAQIAHDMGVSVNTIKTHVRHILDKLDCDNRVEAVQVARQEGLLQ